MSALCQEPTYAAQQNARYFDHLVGGGEQHRRDFKSQRFGDLVVDDELVFGRRLHRQLGRLFALEDAIDVIGRLPNWSATSGPWQISPPPMTIGREE
jgi:hypothetical protein